VRSEARRSRAREPVFGRGDDRRERRKEWVGIGGGVGAGEG